MARWIASVRSAAVGGLPGALVGAPVSFSQGRLAWPLVAAGFLLGAAIATHARALRGLAAPRWAITTAALTGYVVVFLGLQVVPGSAAYLVAIAFMAIMAFAWRITDVGVRRASG
jgi:hypothetical protein